MTNFTNKRFKKLAGLFKEQLEEQSSPTRHMDSAQRVEYLLNKRVKEYSLSDEDYKKLWQWIKAGKIDFRDFRRFVLNLEGD